MADIGANTGLISALAASFGPHLERVCANAAQALETTGFRSLLVHSGSPVTIFEDDRSYPFEAHAPFKVWAPVADAPDSFVYFEPGKRPLLLFHSPADYWHKPAALPQAYWTQHFAVCPISDRAGARGVLPTDLSTTAYIGDAFPELATWAVAAVNPRKLMQRLDFSRAWKTPYELECLREANRIGTRGHLAAMQAFERGASEFEIELAF